jgi:hypothetical protein
LASHREPLEDYLFERQSNRKANLPDLKLIIRSFNMKYLMLILNQAAKDGRAAARIASPPIARGRGLGRREGRGERNF